MFNIGTGSVRAIDAAQIAVQRHAKIFGGSLGNGHAHGQNGIGAQLALGFRPIQILHHVLVDGDLVGSFHADQFVGNDVVDVVDCLEHALAAIALLIAVAQFERFIHARAGAAGDDGPADNAAVQLDFDFDGRIAAAVEYFTRVDDYNFAHRNYTPFGTHVNRIW